jgi:enediyne biosynthesis protein E4
MTVADPITPVEPNTGSKRGRRRWWIAGAAAVVILGAAAIVATTRSGSAATPTAADAPHYVDDTTTSGISHSYDGDFDYFVGGGVASFDCDGDGRTDLYFAGGSSPAALYRNQSPTGEALKFEQIASPVTDLTDVTGAYPIDIDSDGTLDLAVLRHGANEILRGLGNCRFEPAAATFGIDPGADWTTAFSATWETTNRLPTLAFGTYLQPDDTTCGTSWMVRPESPTAARYTGPVALTPGYCTLSMLFSDWSRTGRRDLRLANDRHYYTDGSEQLFRVAPGDAPSQYTSSDGWVPLQVWGMGLASQDLTGDGLPEVFITSQGDNKLQTLDQSAADGAPPTPTYHDIALRAGVTTQRPFTGGDILPSTAWHPEFADVNNDGLVDLFISKGNVDGQTDQAMLDPNDLMIGQTDGTFVQGAEDAGIVGFDKSRGAALVDLNLDGLLDLVVVHREADPSIFRNVGRGDATTSAPMGHWIAIDLAQQAPNNAAIGSWVEVRTADRTLTHEVTIGGGHVSGEAGWIHVGLGDAGSADVRVTWPDGEVGPWIPVDADQFVRITRGDDTATPWQPPG